MAALGLALGGSPVFIVAGDDLPGMDVHSWMANSFARQQGHQWLPVRVCGIGVTPDGTVFSAGVAEGEGGVASYKGGEFVTKYDDERGFGGSASAVAADDAYVSIGPPLACFAHDAATSLITGRPSPTAISWGWPSARANSF